MQFAIGTVEDARLGGVVRDVEAGGSNPLTPTTCGRLPRRRRLAWRAVELAALQDVIERTYGARDRERGVPSTVAWLVEELGELAQAVRKGSPADQVHEFADVLAWVASLANQMGVDLTAAIQRYADGCPRCHALPCACACACA